MMKHVLGVTAIAGLGLGAAVARSYLLEEPGVAVVRAALGTGLTPESVVCGGCGSLQAASVYSDLAECAQQLAAVSYAETASASAAAAVQSASAALAADPSNPELRSAAASAAAAYAAAEETRSAALAALRTAALAGSSNEVKTVTARVLAAANYRVPAAFRVLDRTEEQWRALERAIVAEERALRRSVSVPGDAASLLAATRAELAVIAASQRLDGQLTGATTAFLALGNPG